MSVAFPVKTKTCITTEHKVFVCIHAYSDRIFIVVSELDCGSAGTLVEFRKEFTAGVQGLGGGDTSDTESVYDIHILFGVETPEILLTVRVLGSRVHKSGSTELPILFGIGLKRFDKPLLEEVSRTLIDLLKSL